PRLVDRHRGSRRDARRVGRSAEADSAPRRAPGLRPHDVAVGLRASRSGRLDHRGADAAAARAQPARDRHRRPALLADAQPRARRLVLVRPIRGGRLLGQRDAAGQPVAARRAGDGLAVPPRRGAHGLAPAHLHLVTPEEDIAMRIALTAAAMLLAAASSGRLVVAQAPDDRPLDPQVIAWDKGVDKIDVSKYPAAVKDNYKVFARLCSNCHTLARAVNCDFVLDDDWERY